MDLRTSFIRRRKSGLLINRHLCYNADKLLEVSSPHRGAIMKLFSKVVGIATLMMCAFTLEAFAVGYEQYDTPEQFRNRKRELVQRDVKRSKTFVKESVPEYLDKGAGYVKDVLGMFGLSKNGSKK